MDFFYPDLQYDLQIWNQIDAAGKKLSFRTASSGFFPGWIY